ncbi:hypothetical protein LTR66_014904 [Elasticomyces elasticus]|nr:hypothetical protein LTR66_014904 [Elasticomyces elasticus]
MDQVSKISVENMREQIRSVKHEEPWRYVKQAKGEIKEILNVVRDAVSSSPDAQVILDITKTYLGSQCTMGEFLSFIDHIVAMVFHQQWSNEEMLRPYNQIKTILKQRYEKKPKCLAIYYCDAESANSSTMAFTAPLSKAIVVLPWVALLQREKRITLIKAVREAKEGSSVEQINLSFTSTLLHELCHASESTCIDIGIPIEPLKWLKTQGLIKLDRTKLWKHAHIDNFISIYNDYSCRKLVEVQPLASTHFVSNEEHGESHHVPHSDQFKPINNAANVTKAIVAIYISILRPKFDFIQMDDAGTEAVVKIRPDYRKKEGASRPLYELRKKWFPDIFRIKEIPEDELEESNESN